MSVDVETLRAELAAADAAFGAAVAEGVQAVRDALDAYVEAERRHLGDFIAGRHKQAAERAWDALAAAREALEETRSRAEATRQAAIAAAIGR